MTIVLTGGGSGGHITPLLAVADELKKQRPDTYLVYIGQKGDRLSDIPRQHGAIDASYEVQAGKWRRYHGEGWRQILDLKTVFKNIRDFFRMLAGLWQSYWLLGKLKPDVIFIKGGFVGVPVGLAAALRRIPYITHDSDALPGLANRIIARWAAIHAVGMPAELYSYPPDKTVFSGVPVSADFKPITASEKTKIRQDLGMESYRQIILVTGGGLGAQRLNQAVVNIAADLMSAYPALSIVHTAGRALEEQLQTDYNRVISPKDIARVRVMGYTTELARYSAAADLVIARAGATSMAELASQHKACIIVPNPVLAGGHQLKNIVHLEADKAVKVVREEELAKNNKALLAAVKSLLDDSSQREELGEKFGLQAKPEAAHILANLLLKVGKEPAR